MSFLCIFQTIHSWYNNMYQKLQINYLISNLPTVSTHDLHNECPLVRIGCAHNGINSLDDTVQGRVRAYCHVRTAEIIVNGAYLL